MITVHPMQCAKSVINALSYNTNPQRMEFSDRTGGSLFLHRETREVSRRKADRTPARRYVMNDELFACTEARAKGLGTFRQTVRGG
jgi:hypothetical protein